MRFKELNVFSMSTTTFLKDFLQRQDAKGNFVL